MIPSPTELGQSAALVSHYPACGQTFCPCHASNEVPISFPGLMGWALTAHSIVSYIRAREEGVPVVSEEAGLGRSTLLQHILHR